MGLKSFSLYKYFLLGLVIIFGAVFTFGCNGGSFAWPAKDSPGNEKAVVVSGSGVERETRLTLAEMQELPEARFEHVFFHNQQLAGEKKVRREGS